VTLVLAAYSAPRDVMEKEILPAFSSSYQARTGKSLRVEASYLASGAQARAVLGGFAADVVLLAMSPDVDKLAGAGLVAKTWADGPERGIVASSIVAFAVRTGNPKGVTSWADLARPGVSVLMPNPKTSGGAMWNVSALWGAALRGDAGFPPGDHEAAHDFLRAVLRNVAVLDKGGRESVITFEKGVGDVAITYESEIVAGRLAGRKYDEVVPASTLLIEIPAAVLAPNAAKHGVTSEAEAFVAFLRSDAAQRAFARYVFRKPNSVGRALRRPRARAFPHRRARRLEVRGADAVRPRRRVHEGVGARVRGVSARPRHESQNAPNQVPTMPTPARAARVRPSQFAGSASEGRGPLQP
jgi:sulfate transport system substrate-binding protein